MADTVVNKTIRDSDMEIAIHLNCISDGTGESNVVKIDKSAIAAARGGAEAAALDIESVRWAIQGFTYVKLSWDHNTDDVGLVLSGNGYEDFRRTDQAARDARNLPGLVDPRSTGGTGDLLLTTVGAVSGASYDITIICRKAVA